ncbi:Pro-neuregulin-1, membrane-bound isoform [Liparis tanakae]|uniref:Pro-neuregulin-1, membrane-bound isoform n=1 Tax=Liparis tanakae TaxID=230148 RepID=A0A4Z2FXI2_9TELE|nr:Pro-neuregulin-1, membrane-bound isoform [Liparis tanakae]
MPALTPHRSSTPGSRRTLVVLRVPEPPGGGGAGVHLQLRRVLGAPPPVGAEPPGRRAFTSHLVITVHHGLSLTTLHRNTIRCSKPTALQIASSRAPPKEPDGNEGKWPAATSTTTTAKTSSHVTRCSDRQRNYCVNGGKCFTLEILPGTTKFLCRCPNEFTGDRCQKYVMASFYKAEELYQKRILTITGICIALLVVGVMCVVAYCKTKKQRKKLHDHLRQSLRKKKKKRNNNNNTNLTSSARGRQGGGLPLQDLQLTDVRPQGDLRRCVGPALRDGETETNLSTSKKMLLGHEPSASTDMSVKSWTNDWGSSLLSDTESVSVMSLPENSQRAAAATASQGGRGRLYATGGGGRDLSAHSEKC